MSILARNKKQITLIYCSLSPLGKQVLGYVQAADKKIEAIDIAKEKLGDTIWVEIAEQLELPFNEIFNLEFVENETIENFDNFDADDWIKIVNNNPLVLQRPIAVNGHRVMQVNQRTAILKFFDVDSAGLKKGFQSEPPNITKTTEGEDFI